MTHVSSTIDASKRVALVAHDNRKQDLLEWARFNREALARPPDIGAPPESRPPLTASRARSLGLPPVAQAETQ